MLLDVERLGADGTLDAQLGQARVHLGLGDVARGEACLQGLKTSFQRRRMEEVRSRIRTAERDGNQDEALYWMAELQRVEEEVKHAGQPA